MVRQHRTTAAVVITLALTASLASTASADPAPLARAEAAIAAAHSSPPVVGPNPDEQAAIAAAHSSPPVVRPNPDEQAAIAAAHSSAPVGRPNPDEQAAIAAAHSSAPVVRPNPDEQAAIAAAHSGVPSDPIQISRLRVRRRAPPCTSPLRIAGSTGATPGSEPARPSSCWESDLPALASRQALANGAPGRRGQS